MMNTNEAKKIPLGGLLEKLGHQPKTQKQGELWYISPFRDESDASFKVNPPRNIWHDFGEGRGGTVVDFVMRYYKVDISGALKKLDEIVGNHKISAVTPTPSQKPVQPSLFELINLQPLVNRSLIAYLGKRGIPLDVARTYLQEMNYEYNERPYFALAFANESDGYELRNRYFKGVRGQKDISMLSGQNTAAQTVTVFEGFIDFLSALVYRGKAETDNPVLVLNSTSMSEKAIAKIKGLGVKTVYLYLDHDPGGRELTNYFAEQLPDVDVQDRSALYAGYNDYNEWLVAKQQAQSAARG